MTLAGAFFSNRARTSAHIASVTLTEFCGILSKTLKGLTLTAQQVAALTHDIVWLEEHEVNGEKVLVPVLYMANADNRLAANGALIQGSDVTLIAGKDLINAGTLRASNNLSATAGNDLVNSGLVEAGNRLDLLAGNNLVNKAGGIVAGRDVNLVAVSGDVINERTVTAQDSRYTNTTLHRDYIDSAARIEAANELTISAGRDAINTGVMKSGGDTYIDATRDINVLAVEERNSGQKPRFNSETITQHSASIEAGRDLTLKSGRDIAVVASDISAKRDVSMTAVEDLQLSSDADESHSYSKVRKTTRQTDNVDQVAATVDAGGDVSLKAGGDMTLVSSRITAGDEAYLMAVGKVELLAAQNSDYSLYDMKKKGGWGSKKTQRDEVTHVTNVGTEISTGGDLTVLSGGDQRYQVAKLESAQDIKLSSGGAITFEGVKDLHQESHQKSRNSMTWNSAKGRGNTDETLRQSQLIAQGDLVINAVNGLNIDIKDINKNTVSQTIDAMVKADPGLAWLKEAEARGDVDWQLIKETHESFKYSSSGMGPAAMLAVIIIVTVLTAGTASAAVGTAAGATAGSGTAMAASGVASGAALTGGAAVGSTVGAGLGNIMASAALTSMASGAAVSAINNQGNLGAIAKDVFSSDSLKGYVLAGASAGIASQFGFNPTTLKFDLASAQSVALKVAADAAAKTAIMGGSLKDNLVASALGSAISIGGAVSANKIGDITAFSDGKLSKVVMHAALGGLMAEAMGGDFRSGAIAAGANEVLVDFLADKLLPKGVSKNSLEYQEGVSKLLAASELVGVLTTVATGGDPSIAATVAANATQNNFLNHTENSERFEAIKGCKAGDQKACARRDELNQLDVNRDMAVWAACDGAATSSACTTARTEAQIARFDLLRHQNTSQAQEQMQQALKDPDLMNFTIQGELRSIKMLDDAVIRQISTSISKSLFSIGTDLAPGVGDVKAFAEAEDAWDYIFASIGVVPGVGDAFALGLRKSKQLLKDGKAQEASELLESLANRASGAKGVGEVVPAASVVSSGTTRTGVVRTNAADWRALRDNWDDLGYGQILSAENRTAIAKGRTPKVDDAWIKVFPEDAGLKGERIPMHHIQGSPLTVPLPDTRHLDAHMPGGFRYNPGGPGSALPAYPPKKGTE
ncbi:MULTISPECIES: DUF637 domain-containing protein [unclassified Pseudomonas]|uniref:DUF637 domain-containing protein n=1 Tax=unclassified Pseudomonas TaxID=196821 RepID=UPI001CBEA9BB|nr:MULTISPECIES: DUF637 domain-containing protein [unclassified Pseudomonas]